jgi:hypothetical protein
LRTLTGCAPGRKGGYRGIFPGLFKKNGRLVSLPPCTTE